LLKQVGFSFFKKPPQKGEVKIIAVINGWLNVQNREEGVLIAWLFPAFLELCEYDIELPK